MQSYTVRSEPVRAHKPEQKHWLQHSTMLTTGPFRDPSTTWNLRGEGRGKRLSIYLQINKRQAIILKQPSSRHRTLFKRV